MNIKEENKAKKSGPTENLRIELDEATQERWESQAARSGLTLSAQVEEWIARAMEQEHAGGWE